MTTGDNFTNCITLDMNALELFCTSPPTGYNLSNYFYPGILDDSLNSIAYIKLVSTGILFTVSLIGNGLVAVLVWKNPGFHSSVNCYLMNLAIADLLITCLCMWSLVLTDIYEHYPFWPIVCRAAASIQATCVLGSVLTLAAVALERVYAIILPLRARSLPCKHHCTLALVWLLAVLGAAPFATLKTYQIDTYCDYTDHQCRYFQTPGRYENYTCNRPRHFVSDYHILFSVMLFFLPLSVMFVAYSLIVSRLWRARGVGERCSQSASQLRETAHKKAVRLSCAILAVFTLCWGPVQTLILFAGPYIDGDIVFWLTFMGYSNSALNPIIYVWFSNSFRKELVCMVSRNFQFIRSSSSHTHNTSFTLTTNRPLRSPATRAPDNLAESNFRHSSYQTDDDGTHSTMIHTTVCFNSDTLRSHIDKLSSNYDSLPVHKDTMTAHNDTILCHRESTKLTLTPTAGTASEAALCLINSAQSGNTSIINGDQIIFHKKNTM